VAQPFVDEYPIITHEANRLSEGDSPFYFTIPHTGLHTHGQGLIHVHPFTAFHHHEKLGLKATFGQWCPQVGVTIRHPPYEPFSMEFRQGLQLIQGKAFPAGTKLVNRHGMQWVALFYRQMKDSIKDLQIGLHARRMTLEEAFPHAQIFGSQIENLWLGIDGAVLFLLYMEGKTLTLPQRRLVHHVIRSKSQFYQKHQVASWSHTVDENNAKETLHVSSSSHCSGRH